MKCKPIVMVAVVMFCGSVLTACTSTDTAVESPDTTVSSSVAAETPQAPVLQDRKSEKISADASVAEKLQEAGDGAQDDWFIKEVRKSGVTDKRVRDSILLEVRDEVCRSVRRGYTLSNIVNDDLRAYDLSDEQNGVIIGASLVSQCPQGTVHVNPAGTTPPA